MLLFFTGRARSWPPNASGRTTHRARQGVPADGRRRSDPAGLRLQLPHARGADAQVGRAVLHPPRERRRHHHRAPARHRQRLRRAPARRRRGHARDHRRTSSASSATRSPTLVDGVTKLSQDQLHLQGRSPGRELPQDGRRDGARHPRAARQALRPPRQHADARAHEARGAGAHRARDAGDLRAAREPPRHRRRSRASSRISRFQLPRARRATPSSSQQIAEDASASATSTSPRSARRSRARLAEQGFAADVTGRAKHLYSIWRKMQAQQCDFEQVYDVIAFRVLVESVSDCYAALGVIHSQWTPVPGRFKDYIALPEAEHVPVAAHDGHRPGARAHRDPDPHPRDAPRRRARHRRALEVQGAQLAAASTRRTPQRFGWLRQLMEWQKELKDPAEFLESVKVDLFQDEVYVFTPKGDVRVFPRGVDARSTSRTRSTSQVGEHCHRRARERQDRAAPLQAAQRRRRRDHDATRTSSPTKDWLDFVGHRRAPARRSATTSAPSSATRAQSLGRGAPREGAARGGHQLYASSSRTTPRCAQVLRGAQGAEPRRALHRRSATARSTRGRRRRSSRRPTRTATRASRRRRCARAASRGLVRKVTRRDDGGIRLNGIDDVLVRYAKCCNPLPGDDIIGFITRGRGVTIHRRSCPKAFDTDPERRVEITWDAKAKINRPRAAPRR